MTKPMPKQFKLCYVRHNILYFTDNFEKQWGDDWDDAPYQHNAEGPYEYEDGWPEYMNEHRGHIRYIWYIPKSCDLQEAYLRHQDISVEEINKGIVLRKERGKMKGGKAGVLNRFFSDRTFRNLINGVDDNTYEAVIHKYLQTDFSDFTNQCAIQQIYGLLDKEYRNEYFYKNTILNKLLLHVHSIRTTTALRELPIGKSKADFVLINGKAVVYEIKTELDNFERLGDQVANYYKAFDHVVVVTSIENEREILNFKGIPDTVGIYLLQKNGYFKRLREPVKNDAYIDSEVLFKLLRKQEYLSIILDYYGRVPDVNQFEFYQTCKKWFMDMPLCISYQKTLRILKKRVSVDENAFKQVPYELKFLVYFMEFTSKDYLNLHNFLNSSYGNCLRGETR